jgi:hypothetical protein
LREPVHDPACRTGTAPPTPPFAGEAELRPELAARHSAERPAYLARRAHYLRGVLAAYLRHFNTARPHRFLKQLAPAQAETQPPAPIDLADYQIVRRPVLEGLTSKYQIAA